MLALSTEVAALRPTLHSTQETRGDIIEGTAALVHETQSALSDVKRQISDKLGEIDTKKDEASGLNLSLHKDFGHLPENSDSKFDTLADRLAKSIETSTHLATEKEDGQRPQHRTALGLRASRDEEHHNSRTTGASLALCVLVISGALEGASELARGRAARPGDAVNGGGTRLGLDLWRRWCRSIMLPPNWVDFPKVLLCYRTKLSTHVQRLPTTTFGNALHAHEVQRLVHFG